MDKKQYLRILLIICGNALIAFGTEYFLLPPGFIVGGMTGIANAIRLAAGIPISTSLAALSVVFLIIGYIFIGKEFAAKSALSALIYPIIFFFAERLYDITGPLTENFTLCMCFSALAYGFGVNLIVGNGASSGGLDVIAVLLNKKFGIAVSKSLNVIEIVSMLTQAPNSTKEGVLAGFLIIIAYTSLLGRFLASGISRIQVMIYSPEYEKLSTMIHDRFNRGTTLFREQGGYLREDTFAVQTIIDKRDLFSLKKDVLEIDPDAFITISNVSEVSGIGFTIAKPEEWGKKASDGPDTQKKY